MILTIFAAVMPLTVAISLASAMLETILSVVRLGFVVTVSIVGTVKLSLVLLLTTMIQLMWMPPIAASWRWSC